MDNKEGVNYSALAHELGVDWKLITSRNYMRYYESVKEEYLVKVAERHNLTVGELELILKAIKAEHGKYTAPDMAVLGIDTIYNRPSINLKVACAHIDYLRGERKTYQTFKDQTLPLNWSDGRWSTKHVTGYYQQYAKIVGKADVLMPVSDIEQMIKSHQKRLEIDRKTVGNGRWRRRLTCAPFDPYAVDLTDALSIVKSKSFYHFLLYGV